MCVGARLPLVAYNVWLAEPDLALARRIARRRPRARTSAALGLAVGRRVQVSMNLVAPDGARPGRGLRPGGRPQAPGSPARSWWGWCPQEVLLAIPAERWDELDLGPDRTIEARLAHVGARPTATHRPAAGLTEGGRLRR